jgi:hypothetical protein
MRSNLSKPSSDAGFRPIGEFFPIGCEGYGSRLAVDLIRKRGSFHDSYALTKNKTATTAWDGFRLLDLMLSVVRPEHPDYLEMPAPGEFAVIDTVTKEKGWFEAPTGITDEKVTSMIASTFDASAYLVAHNLWIV